MLECVINISEGRRDEAVDQIADGGGTLVLDVHRDRHHNRSVITMAGDDVEDAARQVARTAVDTLDLRNHQGVHPRIGSVDVVPFVPLGDTPMIQAIEARNRFGEWAATDLGLPCFYYGPERSLPELRRHAFQTLEPDAGPKMPHPTAGAACVGARRVLVAYNLWLRDPDIETARRIAKTLRSEHLRTLPLLLGEEIQISCNLTEPGVIGPAEAFDAVSAFAPIARAELVGLLPESVLRDIPRSRWDELDVGKEKTIEWRLASS